MLRCWFQPEIHMIVGVHIVPTALESNCCRLDTIPAEASRNSRLASDPATWFNDALRRKEHDSMNLIFRSFAIAGRSQEGLLCDFALNVLLLCFWTWKNHKSVDLSKFPVWHEGYRVQTHMCIHPTFTYCATVLRLSILRDEGSLRFHDSCCRTCHGHFNLQVKTWTHPLLDHTVALAGNHW